MWPAPEGEVGFYNGRRVVEELDSDDSASQGVGLANVSGNRRKSSDQYQPAMNRSWRGYAPQSSDSGSSDGLDTEHDTEDETQIALRESEEALVQSALARIRKAQAKGKQDVRLNKEELAALERRRKRLQAEAKKKKKAASSSKSGESKRRKEKEQRYAVPIAHLETSEDDMLPQHPSPTALAESQGRLRPPKGVFPPPNSSHSRPRSTSSSHRPQSGYDNFDYQYVHPPPTSRHASDPSARHQYYAQQYQDDRQRSASSLSRQGLDPFQFQTEASQRPSYPPSDEHTSGEDSSVSSHGRASGSHLPRNRSREEVVVEQAPEPEPDRETKGRKTRSSSTKRKPVPTTSSSTTTSTRRRKGR